MKNGQHSIHTILRNIVGAALALWVLMAAPTGYVRYTTTEERRMLNQMQKDCDVDPVYVLDMYRHGKVNWMLDVALRLAALLVAGIIGLKVREFRKKRRPAYTDNVWRDKNAI